MDCVFVFRGRDRSLAPEDMQRTLAAWRDWFDGLKRTGRLKDPGHPLLDRRTRIAGRARSIVDGPYIETKDLIAGFVIVSVASLDEAKTVAAGCPILDVDGSVEICEVEPMAS